VGWTPWFIPLTKTRKLAKGDKDIGDKQQENPTLSVGLAKYLPDERAAYFSFLSDP
jgi:hypothetical protein